MIGSYTWSRLEGNVNNDENNDFGTNPALDDAMRVLGGPKRRFAVAGVVGIAVGAALVVIGAVGALLSALI